MIKTKEDHENKSIIFFDGVCNLCNGTVDWILKRNSDQDLYFSSLQSDFAHQFLENQDLGDLSYLETVLFLENGKLYCRSAAIFKIMLHLKGIYPSIGKLLSWMPSFISDFVYKLMARYRYQIFGKKDFCRIPGPEEKSRFLE